VSQPAPPSQTPAKPTGTSPAPPSLGALEKIKSGGTDKATDAKKKTDEIHISEKAERQIGEQISLSLRTRFGVVQDLKVTKYVTLVGSTLTQASERPNLDWKFIVLDTDAVNAFAAPGGFIHVTRGLLGFCKNEAELAGVLGHEITHVTAKHTVHFIEHSNQISFGAGAASSKERYGADVLTQIAERAGHFIFDNQYDQGQEDQADEIGVQLANELGYDPHGLQDVLKRLDARNSGRNDKNGWFSSHPATKDRINHVEKVISKDKLAGKATVEARYKEDIPYEAKPITEIAMDTSGASGLASGDKKKDDDKSADDKKADNGRKKGFGLGSVTGGSKRAQSNQQVASAGARGVGVPDRDAKGGSNPSSVNVKVTAAEVDAFKKDQAPPAPSTLPEFPWPPPATSAQTVLSDRFFRPPSNGVVLANVGDRLVAALERAGYVEYSFYHAPGGFALVARLERIGTDGTPLPEQLRFLAPRSPEPFSLTTYIERLFFAPAGFYRQIVLAVTNQSFSATGARLNADGAAILLSRGANSLPDSFQALPFTDAHRVTALIYEFYKGPMDRDVRMLAPSRLGARTHLERARIYQSLEQPR
jgi:hypothetical protein